MPYHAPSAYSHLEFDFQNEGMLLQFLLKNYLGVHAQLCHAEELLLAAPSPASYLSESEHHLFTQIFFDLLSPSNPSPWNQGKCALAQLQDHSYLLCQGSHTSCSARLQLSRGVDRTVEEVLKCQRKLTSLPVSREKAALAEELKKVRTKARSLSRHLLHVLEAFHEDENVWLFCLQHHSQLQAAFGARSLAKTMQRMYTSGIPELVAFLKERYRSRGFDHLLPQIEQSISHELSKT